MTPEARKVIHDAKHGIKRCKAMNAELRGRIARLERLDTLATAAASADQLKWLLKMMQGAAPDNKQTDIDCRIPEAA